MRMGFEFLTTKIAFYSRGQQVCKVLGKKGKFLLEKRVQSPRNFFLFHQHGRHFIVLNTKDHKQG